MQENLILAYTGLDSPERASENLETARVSLEEEEAPNAGVASFFDPESICGDDKRIQIPVTMSPPHYYICYLYITAANGAHYKGSGFLINVSGIDGAKYQLVATSGHCVYIKYKGPMSSVDVYPGRYGTQTPYEKYTVSGAGLQASDKWKNSGDSNFDYGAIILPKAPGGGMGVAAPPDSYFNDRMLVNAGYPGDKTTATMWAAGGPVSAVSPNKIEYMIDTYGGQSGSPVWNVYKESVWMSFGIHGYGGCPNKAVRWTSDMWKDYKSWAK